MAYVRQEFDKEHSQKATLCGKEAYVYSHGYVDTITKNVKHNDPDAIAEIADFLTSQIDEDCFLVPAPQHTGKAEYTLEICKLIEKMSPYNITILDVMQCQPRDTLYDLKRKARTKLTKDVVQQLDTGMTLKEALSDLEGPIYFVDNVVATGATLRDAVKLIPNIKPLVFAVSSRYLV